MSLLLLLLYVLGAASGPLPLILDYSLQLEVTLVSVSVTPFDWDDDVPFYGPDEPTGAFFNPSTGEIFENQPFYEMMDRRLQGPYESARLVLTGDYVRVSRYWNNCSAPSVLHRDKEKVVRSRMVDGAVTIVERPIRHAEDKTERVDNLRASHRRMKDRLSAGLVGTAGKRDVFEHLTGQRPALPRQSIWMTYTFRDREQGSDYGWAQNEFHLYIKRVKDWIARAVDTDLVFTQSDFVLPDGRYKYLVPEGGIHVRNWFGAASVKDGFRYFSASEPQGDGTWHFHCIFSFPYASGPVALPDSVRDSLWGRGYARFQSCPDGSHVANYVSAYLSDIPWDELPDDVRTQYELEGVLPHGPEGKKILKGGRLPFYPVGARMYSFSQNWPKAVDVRGLAPETAESLFQSPAVSWRHSNYVVSGGGRAWPLCISVADISALVVPILEPVLLSLDMDEQGYVRQVPSYSDDVDGLLAGVEALRVALGCRPGLSLWDKDYLRRDWASGDYSPCYALPSDLEQCLAPRLYDDGSLSFADALELEYPDEFADLF